MQHSEFQVIWNYDVVFCFFFFFSVWKALLELCFCLSGIHIRFIFLWQKWISCHIIVSNTLYFNCLMCVCVGEWVKEVGFGSFYSPPPPLLHWMMLGQVFLFWCVSYLSMLLLLSSLSPICALTVGLLLFSARSVSSYWTVGYFGSWPVKGTWRCDWLLS